jgi:hypothetical protein
MLRTHTQIKSLQQSLEVQIVSSKFSVKNGDRRRKRLPVDLSTGGCPEAGGRGSEHHEVERREGSGTRRKTQLARDQGRSASSKSIFRIEFINIFMFYFDLNVTI